MFAKSFVLLLGLSFALGAKLQVTIKANAKIQQLKSESEKLAEVHALSATTCFAQYNPILESIATQYENDYNSCIGCYNSSSNSINEQWDTQVSEIKNSSSALCSNLCNCKNIGDAVDNLQCISSNATSNEKTLYDISVNASQYAIQITQQYNAIETSKATCISSAEDSYVQNTATTYEDLNACLRGDVITSTVAPNDATSTQSENGSGESGDDDEAGSDAGAADDNDYSSSGTE